MIMTRAGAKWTCREDVVGVALGHWPLPLLGRPHFTISLASPAEVKGGPMAGWLHRLAVPYTTWEVRCIDKVPVLMLFVSTKQLEGMFWAGIGIVVGISPSADIVAPPPVDETLAPCQASSFGRALSFLDPPVDCLAEVPLP